MPISCFEAAHRGWGLRAGMVSDLAELDGCPYCGHSACLGKKII
ncbi:MAG: hypothetical protein R6X27_07155 [Candidatus Desulfacyla sp.]